MAKNTYRRHDRRPVYRWMELASYAGVGFGLLLLVVVCYFEFVAPEAIPPHARTESAPPAVVAPDDALTPDKEGAEKEAAAKQPDGTAALPSADGETADSARDVADQDVPQEEADDPNAPIQGVIEQGDTAGVLFQEWLSPGEIHNMVENCKNVYSLARLRVGQPYTVHRENGILCRIEYEIDNDSRLIIDRESEGESQRWTARVEAIEYEVRLTRVEGAITSSLFEAMTEAGETPALAVRLAEIFAWEINFIRDIQPGDSFRALVEKRYRDGEFKGYGSMPVAEFVNRSSKFEAYRYQDSFGNNTYFNAAGDSLKRAFLKAPLSFTRISSRFNLRRVHPIFNTVRAHPAVDYAAPKGTPVKAIGSGTVVFRGFNKGAGNFITLKHGNGYESMYLHLNGFAKNLKQGGRVRQGEIIGYVGSTGYSTGPHLDFRMKKNGQFVNPEKALSPRDDSVPKQRIEAFKGERDMLRRFLEGDIALSEYVTSKETQVQ